MNEVTNLHSGDAGEGMKGDGGEGAGEAGRKTEKLLIKRRNH